MNVFNEVGLCFDPLVVWQVSPDELAGGVASPGYVCGVAGSG